MKHNPHQFLQRRYLRKRKRNSLNLLPLKSSWLNSLRRLNLSLMESPSQLRVMLMT